MYVVALNIPPIVEARPYFANLTGMRVMNMWFIATMSEVKRAKKMTQIEIWYLPTNTSPARGISESAKQNAVTAISLFLNTFSKSFVENHAPLRFTIGRSVESSTEKNAGTEYSSVMSVGTHEVTPSLSIP